MSDKMQGMAREYTGRAQRILGDSLGDARTQAQGMYNEASGQAQQQLGRFADTVRDQPLTATLIALGLGYIIGRLTA